MSALTKLTSFSLVKSQRFRWVEVAKSIILNFQIDDLFLITFATPSLKFKLQAYQIQQ